MKCNVKELALMSDAPCVIEGRLNYKKTSNGAIRDSVFKERWFRLVKNYLFYFRLSEMGKFDARAPAGVFVLENSSVQMEHGQSISFAFSISFIEEPEKRHVLAARTQDAAVRWVLSLRSSSYEYLRERLHLLQSKIFAISGNDPLLLVPRNEGAKLWAPSAPFSAVPACSAHSAGFSCHLHTNGHLFTLDRSKSDVHVSRRHRRTNTTTFHTALNAVETQTRHEQSHSSTRDLTEDRDVRPLQRSNTEDADGCFALEISKNALPQHRLNPFDNIFDSDTPYTRPAPSPPVRKKTSPRQTRVNGESSQSPTLSERSRHIGATSILEPVPSIPPRRKVSPKYLELIDSKGVTDATQPDQEEDLIKF